MCVRTASNIEAKAADVQGGQYDMFDSGSGRAVKTAADGSVLRFAPFEVPLPASGGVRPCSRPTPYNKMTQFASVRNARDLREGDHASMHPVLTSPPYWTVKTYGAGSPGQLGLSTTTILWRTAAPASTNSRLAQIGARLEGIPKEI